MSNDSPDLSVAAILAIEAEQRGIISSGQAQELNDLRDELESESSHNSYQSVELPFAADAAVSKETGGIIKISGHFEGPEIEAYENEDAVLKKAVWLSDAEDAVRQREQKVRREILGEVAHMLDEKIIKRNTIGNEDLKNDEQASAFFDELTIEIELLRDLESSLSEDLESSEYGDSTQGLRDDLQQEQEEEVDAS
jgi:hypothetical protein